MVDSDTETGLFRSIDEFDSFREVRNVPPELISDRLIGAIKQLDEKEEVEPYIRRGCK